ncbi:hypothetical protein QTP70_005929 [Hemibagrus guttatus]|uniref:Uncharacterized protein n=1 Tax=Hemibagrus guttatus TaxID=175788 RepID=A0AAE0R147_9TELE|nr:hypothetical protein QTP70_005929 [Hemibagrus guttatus]
MPEFSDTKIRTADNQESRIGAEVSVRNRQTGTEVKWDDKSGAQDRLKRPSGSEQCEFVLLSKRLLDDEELQKNLRTNGKRYVMERHDCVKERTTYQQLVEKLHFSKA